MFSNRRRARRSFTPSLDVLSARIAPGGIAFEPLPITELDGPQIYEPPGTIEGTLDPMGPQLVVCEEVLPWKSDSPDSSTTLAIDAREAWVK